VAICGTWRIAVVTGLLVVLAVAEAAVIGGYAAADVISPASEGVTTGSIVPARLSVIDRPVLGILLAFAVLAFVGLETAGTYAEEAGRPRRDTGRAAFLAVALFTVLLAGGAWSLAVAAGPDRVGLLAQQFGQELVFTLAADRLAPWAITLGRAVLLAGLVAAMIALHQAFSRYLYALGREQIFPRGLGLAARRTGAPRSASLTQSVIVAVALGAAYLAKLNDPAVLARRLAALGGLGILVLLLATSVAALLHLNRVPNGEGTWARFVAPILSTVTLGVLCYLAFRDLPALLGVRPADNLIWIVPGSLGAVALVGFLHAWMLRGTRPVAYAGIGQGGAPVVITPTVPKPREPGAHRPERIL
jgi:amino acid transporter